MQSFFDSNVANVKQIQSRRMQKLDKGKNDLHIKNWPEGNRPREMFLEKGPEALSDAVLLAILLRTGRQGKNAIALAKEMINTFGGLNGLMMATSEDLLGESSF